MKIGMIGLGKMGMNLVSNLLEHKHEVVAFDMNPDSVSHAADKGAVPANSLEQLVASLEAPRVIWAMVPPADLCIRS
ncbi:hypothetical protein HMSSN036_81800 [Paenibacillus macerans]|nr:hypothetical protein HMSSN036_81800 [Paenibacillus macerans]